MRWPKWTTDEALAELTPRFMRHPQRTSKATKRFVGKSTDEERVKYIKGCIEEWKKNTVLKKKYNGCLVQGGLINPR